LSISSALLLAHDVSKKKQAASNRQQDSLEVKLAVKVTIT
jgi:hypothetical protein